MRHILEIHKNAEGSKLAYLGPERGDSCLRIAGPKAWGGSTELARLVIDDRDLVNYIKDYAPHLIKELLEIGE